MANNNFWFNRIDGDKLYTPLYMSKPNKKSSQSSNKCSPYERTKREVYATGNKWSIENFNATH